MGVIKYGQPRWEPSSWRLAISRTGFIDHDLAGALVERSGAELRSPRRVHSGKTADAIISLPPAVIFVEGGS